MLVDHLKKNLPPGWYGPICTFIAYAKLMITAAFHTNMWTIQLQMDIFPRVKISKNIELALLRRDQWAHPIFPERPPERSSA